MRSHIHALPNRRRSQAILKTGSKEARKSRRTEWIREFLLSYPLFLTSDLPIFAGLAPEGDRKASNGMRLRSMASLIL
jgi:hypothetical protein